MKILLTIILLLVGAAFAFAQNSEAGIHVLTGTVSYAPDLYEFRFFW